MKARVLPLESDAHRQAQELLPWLVSGALDAAEAAPLEAHVAGCGRCRDDAESLQRLRAAVVDEGPSGDVERAWAALRSRLDADRPLAGRGAPAFAPPLRGWRAVLPLAVALQAVVIVVLAGMLLVLVPRGEPYRALGSTAAPVEAQAVVRFVPEATDAQMAAALRAVDAHVVGGPTATGAWLLRLADASPDALARLRARPGVAGVESLQGGPAR